MAKLTIEGIHPGLDGEYELDGSYFTNRELHAIKQASGITAGRMEEAFSALDNDLVVCLAMVALLRAGKITSRTPWASPEIDALWDAAAGKIALDFSDDEEEDEERPPEQTPPGGDDSGRSASDSEPSSGSGSSAGGESPDDAPSPTGSQP